MPPTAAPAVPQATNSTDALNNIQSFQNSMTSPADAYSQASQSLGVPQAQQQVSGLRQAITNTTNLLNNVAPSVMGRTQNSLVTSGQANRQIQNEQTPIAAQLGHQQQDYTGANSDLEHLLSQAGQQADLKVQGQNGTLGALKTIYDALTQQEQMKQQAAQTSASQALEQQKLQEQQREFNTSNAGSNAYLDFLHEQMLHNTPTQTAAAVDPLSLSGVQRKGVAGGNFGYSFTDSNKQPVSAATFANINGLNVADVLKSMAGNGDQYANQAYNELANNGGHYDQNFKNKYSSLFWGS